MKIKKIALLDFKGVKNVSYEIKGDRVVNITGYNGSGKTTIMDAWMWLWFDKDSQLVSNPNIRPIDENETVYEPTVQFDIEVAGKPVCVKKSQKKKVSKDGKVSLTNSYEVNSVPKSERDFKIYFEELGFNFSTMLMLSHTDVFTTGLNEKKQREAARDLLFSMASDMTDLEVASKTADVEELKILLKDYTMEEIQAMQAATVRKIKEQFGKDGEIIDAQILGKEQLRVDVDTSELELLKKSLLEEIDKKKNSLNDVNSQYKEFENLSNGIFELKFKLSDMERNANADFVNKKAEHERTIREKEIELSNKRSDLARSESEKRNAELVLFAKEKLLESKKDEYRSVYAEMIGESYLVCPTCGQELQPDKIESIKADFNSKKKARLDRITVEGNEAKKQVDNNKSIIERETQKMLAIKSEIADIESELNRLKSVEVKNDIDITSTDEYKAILNEIAEKENALHSGNNADEIKRNIMSEIDDLQLQLREVEKKISSISINDKIDAQIDELQESKLRLSQEKANCEKILYQIDLLNRKKNELLTDQINSHFTIVKWKMYKYLKNGSYEQDCTPTTLDGKVLGESTNTALSLMMKLDIANSLQKYFNQYYPIWLDGAEAFDNITKKEIIPESQLFLLKVSDERLKVN